MRGYGMPAVLSRFLKFNLDMKQSPFKMLVYGRNSGLQGVLQAFNSRREDMRAIIWYARPHGS